MICIYTCWTFHFVKTQKESYMAAAEITRILTENGHAALSIRKLKENTLRSFYIKKEYPAW